VSDAQQRLGLVNGAGKTPLLVLCAALRLTSQADDGLSDEIIDPIQTLILPEPDIGNLADIENTMRMANSTTHGRDTLARYVMSNDYISKLVPLVQTAEDFESLPDLHRLCNIMKTVILLNDNAIIEQVVKDDLILGVVGALECDVALRPAGDGEADAVQMTPTSRATRRTTASTCRTNRGSRRWSRLKNP
jgi:hypothetical protein